MTAPIDRLLDAVEWTPLKCDEDPPKDGLPYATHEGVLSFPSNFGTLSITAAGGVTLADGVSHGGSSAGLTLGTGVTITQSGLAHVLVRNAQSGAYDVRVLITTGRLIPQIVVYVRHAFPDTIELVWLDLDMHSPGNE